MRHPRESRDSNARYAGHILYNSVSRSGSGSANSSLMNSGSITALSIPEDERACCGIMSPVRRTFCLVLLFDFVLTFLLWVIYTQIAGKPIEQAFTDEVLHYTFHSSLFDTVMCAAWRFVPLLLAYALFRLRRPWPIAICTLVTCVYLIVKVFKYDFKQDKNNFMSYMLLIVSFVITWIETWFLDFKVLPQEAKAREREALYRSINENHIDDLGYGYPNRETYYSPEDSREGSDDELLVDHKCDDDDDDDFRSLPGTRSHSRKASGDASSFNLTLGDQEQDYREIAESAWDEAWDMIHDETEEWKLESGKDDETGCVYTRTFPTYGKVFKLKGLIDCSPKALFQELVFRVSESPKWNPTVLEIRVCNIIDNNTDILYTVAAESAGGVISSRCRSKKTSKLHVTGLCERNSPVTGEFHTQSDFVNVRRWGMREGMYVSCGKGVCHPTLPPTEKHVRGVNGPGIWLFKAVPEDPNRCHYSCLINTDLKGWIPQYIIDQAMAGVMLTYFKSMRQHIDDIFSDPPV